MPGLCLHFPGPGPLRLLSVLDQPLGTIAPSEAVQSSSQGGTGSGTREQEVPAQGSVSLGRRAEGRSGCARAASASAPCVLWHRGQGRWPGPGHLGPFPRLLPRPR